MSEVHMLSKEDAVKFVTAGNARFTLVSKRTGTRFTYRLVAPKLTKDGDPVAKDGTPVRFLSVLTGANNEADYAFAGTVVGGKCFKPSAKAKLSPDAPSVKAFCWVLENCLNGPLDAAEVWHEGTCGRCGRTLTDPESIVRGLGPDCCGKVACP